MVIWLERDADLHMAQLMLLPLSVSCFSKIQIGFTFLVPAHLGSPGKRAVKRVKKTLLKFITIITIIQSSQARPVDLQTDLLTLTRSQYQNRNVDHQHNSICSLFFIETSLQTDDRWSRNNVFGIEFPNLTIRTPSTSCASVYINTKNEKSFTESSPKNGSNTKTQQYKLKYKQSENNDQVYHTS